MILKSLYYLNPELKLRILPMYMCKALDQQLEGWCVWGEHALDQPLEGCPRVEFAQS